MKFLKTKESEKSERIKIFAFWVNSVLGYHKVTAKHFGEILSDGILIAKVFYKLSEYGDPLSQEFFKEYSTNFNKLNNIQIIVKKIEQAGKISLSKLNKPRIASGDEVEIISLLSAIISFWGFRPNFSGHDAFVDWIKDCLPSINSVRLQRDNFSDTLHDPTFINTLLNATEIYVACSSISPEPVPDDRKKVTRATVKRLNNFLNEKHLLHWKSFLDRGYSEECLLAVLSVWHRKHYLRKIKRRDAGGNLDSLCGEIRDLLLRHIRAENTPQLTQSILSFVTSVVSDPPSLALGRAETKTIFEHSFSNRDHPLVSLSLVEFPSDPNRVALCINSPASKVSFGNKIYVRDYANDKLPLYGSSNTHSPNNSAFGKTLSLAVYSKSNGTENEMDAVCVGNFKKGKNGNGGEGAGDGMKCGALRDGGGEEYVVIIENVGGSGEERLTADELSSGIGSEDEEKRGNV